MMPTVATIANESSREAFLVVAYDEKLDLLFRFRRDFHVPTRLNNRFTNYTSSFNDANALQTSPVTEAMHGAIQDAIESVWEACTSHPTVHLRGAVIEVRQDEKGELCWSICHDSLFQKYLSCLRSVRSIENSFTQQCGRCMSFNRVPLDSLQCSQVLSGRAGARMVRRKCTPSEITYAYKSLSFFDFLLTYPYSEEKFNNFYQELHVLNALPHHANIMAPSRALVTMSLDGLNKAPSDGDSRLVCGTLYRYPGRQSLQQLLDKSTSNSKRLPLGSKAKWAYQMSSAMATVHASNQYHMDLRPANILLNEEQDAVLMKWEQSDTSEHFVAPEAEGDWDVELTSADGASCLVANSGMLAYKYHPRPVLAERRRWPSANVFPIWQKACPLALEAAEMYSLGKTLWSIFEQADEKCCQVHSSILEPGSLRWDAKSADIPDSWKQFVNVCVSYDANERGRFADAATFWEHELETLGQRDMCGHCNGTGRMA